MAEKFLSFVDKLFWAEKKDLYLNDFIDKCHHTISASMFTFFALFIGSWIVAGQPINCFVPPEFPGDWSKYIHSVCFINGTYLRSIEDPEHGTDDLFHSYTSNILYYQWIPYVFALQAAFFCLPSYLWMMHANSDIDYHSIVSLAIKTRTLTGAERTKTIASNVEYFGEGCEQLAGYKCWCTMTYSLSKILNSVNVIAQLLILNMFVAHGDHLWGYKIVMNWMTGSGFDTGTYFPRTAFCSIGMLGTHLGQDNMREVNCALVVNTYIEKVCLIAYCWLFVLLPFTFLDTIWSVFSRISSAMQLRYIKELLQNSYHHKGTVFRKSVSIFITNYLGSDGTLVLRFIDHHAGSRVASEIACGLYETFSKNRDGNYRLQFVSSGNNNKIASEVKKIHDHD